MLEYKYSSTFSEYDLKHKKDKILHSELDFRPVQILTGHVIYNSPYKYWPNENGQNHVNQISC